jgi:5'-nucleotidase
MRRRSFLLLACLLVAAWVTAGEGGRPHVLITNDDGIDAPGIAALVGALKDAYRITVAAPAVEQSGVGQAIVYRTPVLVEERDGSDGVKRYAIHATPATCARIGIANLAVNDPPVLVLSGINWGDNVGQSAWISGTLGGAREAALMRFPAVAFSAACPRGKEPDFAAAGRVARAVVDQLLAAGQPQKGQVVKVEIPFPAAEARGFRVTRMGLEPPRDQSYAEKPGSHGERLFISSWAPPDHDAPGSDIEALVNGFVTITPLTIDQTDYYGIPALSGLNWRLPGVPLPLPRPTAPEAEIHP